MSGSSVETTDRRVIVVGAGLAGLAAAAMLGRRGFRVTLLESRPRPGGRASSFADRESGDAIDNCQHVSMGCCVNFRHFARQLNFDDLFVTQRELTFVGPPPESRPVRFSAAALPAPLHLAPGLLRMPWLRWREKQAIACGMRKLAAERSRIDRPFADWLTEHGQNATVQRRFWHVVLVSALSESLDRISLCLARKVFVDGFLKNRTGWEIAVPTVPLDQIHTTRVLPALRGIGVNVQLGTGVNQILIHDGKATGVELRNGERQTARHFVLAVPHWRVLALLPDTVAEAPDLQGIRQIETAPISSVHLWYDRPPTDLPHAAFIDRLSQWMFHRSRLGTESFTTSEREQPVTGECYLQVVISNSRDAIQRGSEDLIATVDRELRDVWPGSARLLRGRLVTEHRAVFSPLPGVESLRPEQQSPIPNLQLAGDWTQTGWPSTMESAVRSGYLAAQNILRQHNLDEHLLADDLPAGRLSRWLFPV